MSFLVIWFGSCCAFAALCFSPFWFDRVIVWALRSFRIFAFPDAIRLAVSLERDGAEWQPGHHTLEHSAIGTLYYPDSVGILHLKVSDNLEWRPNWIERRIIYDAAKYALRRRIHQQLDQRLPR